MVKIRILVTPNEAELDGVRLDVFQPGKVCDVSSSLGAWLIANGYALAEMRAPATTTEKPRADDRRRSSQRLRGRTHPSYRYR